MPTDDSAATRTTEFFRLLDAKDEAALRARWVDDPQAADEITRGWLRGRLALEDYFQENLPHLRISTRPSTTSMCARGAISRSRPTSCARPTSSTARGLRSRLQRR